MEIPGIFKDVFMILEMIWQTLVQISGDFKISASIEKYIQVTFEKSWRESKASKNRNVRGMEPSLLKHRSPQAIVTNDSHYKNIY